MCAEKKAGIIFACPTPSGYDEAFELFETAIPAGESTAFGALKVAETINGINKFAKGREVVYCHDLVRVAADPECRTFIRDTGKPVRAVEARMVSAFGIELKSVVSGETLRALSVKNRRTRQSSRNLSSRQRIVQPQRRGVGVTVQYMISAASEFSVVNSLGILQ